MINFESDTGAGNIGLLDIMSTLALLFILLSAIFMIDLRNQTFNISALSLEKDSLKNAEEQRIIYLNSLERKYLELQKQLDSTAFAASYFIDSLSERNRILIKELSERQVAKIIIPNQLKGKVFFKSGSNRIEGQFKSNLDRYVGMIKDSLASGRYNHVQVEGHTDSDRVGSSGRYADNWDLGAARASEVVRYFVSKGIPPQSLSATSHAEYKPTADPGDESSAAKEKNRRIEIVLLKK